MTSLSGRDPPAAQQGSDFPSKIEHDAAAPALQKTALMRTRLVALVIAVLLGRAAWADSATHVRVGLAGQLGSRSCSGECGAANGAGPSLRALWDLSARVRLGAALESLWYLASSVELEVTQQDLLALAQLRLSPGAAIDVGLGVSRYSGRVDIPETPGCFGCGRYGDTTYSPQLRAGMTFSTPVAGALAFELSAHGILSLPLGAKTDVHDFEPPSQSLRVDAGLAVAF